MTRLSWSNPGERLYEFGVDHGVFYPVDGTGVAWNGLITVKEAPSDLVDDVQYIDGQKYSRFQEPDSFSGQIEAYTYPDEFIPYDGYDDGFSSQYRKPFNFSYQTRIGSSEDNNLGYKIHLVYNALVSPTTRKNSSINSSSDVEPFSLDLTTNPIAIPGSKPTAHLIIDSRIMYSWAMEELQNLLYGTETTPPQMPQPKDIIDLFERNAILRVTDHGDGTFTVDGPSEAIQNIGPNKWSITWPSVIFLNGNLYQISSL